MKDKTLLYLASGSVVESYLSLPFKQMIFIDRKHNVKEGMQARCVQTGNRIYNYDNNKLIFIEADVLYGIEMLRDKNLKIDYVVSVNEGLLEGGGNFSVLSDVVMGYLSPILADEFYLVWNPDYYGKSRMRMQPEWGFEKSEVEPDDINFIFPSLFSAEERNQDKISNPEYGKVFRMVRNRKSRDLPVRKGLQCNVVYGSIWDDKDNLDLMGINLILRHAISSPANREHSVDGFFRNKGVYDLYQKSIEEIIEHAKSKGLRRLGLSPWQQGNYSDVLKYLETADLGCVESITFYHLDKKDFKELYKYENR
jgi:hypothetical protein